MRIYPIVAPEMKPMVPFVSWYERLPSWTEAWTCLTFCSEDPSPRVVRIPRPGHRHYGDGIVNERFKPSLSFERWNECSKWKYVSAPRRLCDAHCIQHPLFDGAMPFMMLHWTWRHGGWDVLRLFENVSFSIQPRGIVAQRGGPGHAWRPQCWAKETLPHHAIRRKGL